MNPYQNPYQFSNPVYHWEDFFDRGDNVGRLLGAVVSNQSVQLIGQYRMGKSSLLRYVQRNFDDLIHGNLARNERRLIIYYDLSRRPSVSDANDFFARIWQLLARALVEGGEQHAVLAPDVDLKDWYTFDEYLARWVEQEGYRPFFFLDEAATVIGNPVFDHGFLENLRAETGRLHFVLAAPRSIKSYAQGAARTSPFWNLLEIQRLGLFDTRDAIDELIRTPAARLNHVWTDEEEAFIYARGGQHPCYIQMAAAALFGTLEGRKTNQQRADKRFRETAHEHFHFFWQKGLADVEGDEKEAELRATLLAICEGASTAGDILVLEALSDRGLIWQNPATAGWEPFSAAFGDWVLRWNGSRQSSGRQAKVTAPLPPPPENFTIGSIVRGKYRVREELSGSNKYHHVVIADDEILGRKVVIKCLRVSDLSEDAVRRLGENLIRGAGIMAGMQSRHVNQVFDVIERPVGVVLEWIEGTSLDQRIRESGPLPPAEVRAIGIVLARTLEYVHAAGVVHRDIKPGNVILTADERVAVLIDFDVARATSRETITRLEDGSFGRIGTVAYSAPEQLLNPEGVGALTDMFALGTLLYEALTGKLPFEYGNVPALYEGGLPRPDQSAIPDDLFILVCALLEEQPKRRPTAAQLREALEAAS